VGRDLASGDLLARLGALMMIGVTTAFFVGAHLLEGIPGRKP
jgi:hypothetical protein